MDDHLSWRNAWGRHNQHEHLAHLCKIEQTSCPSLVSERAETCALKRCRRRDRVLGAYILRLPFPRHACGVCPYVLCHQHRSLCPFETDRDGHLCHGLGDGVRGLRGAYDGLCPFPCHRRNAHALGTCSVCVFHVPFHGLDDPFLTYHGCGCGVACVSLRMQNETCESVCF